MGKEWRQRHRFCHGHPCTLTRSFRIIDISDYFHLDVHRSNTPPKSVSRLVPALITSIWPLPSVFGAFRFYKGIVLPTNPKDRVSYLRNPHNWEFLGLITLTYIQTWLGDSLVVSGILPSFRNPSIAGAISFHDIRYTDVMSYGITTYGSSSCPCFYCLAQLVSGLFFYIFTLDCVYLSLTQYCLHRHQLLSHALGSA